MRQIILFMAMLFVAPPAFSQTAEPSITTGWPEGTFINDAYGAYQKAYFDGVPLTIFFTADWCNYCKAMQRDLLGAPARQDGSEGPEVMWTHGVLLVLDVEHDDAYGNVRQIQDRLGITEFPAFAFLSVRESEVKLHGRIVGYHDPLQFMDSLSQVHPYLVARRTQAQAPEVGWPPEVMRDDFAAAYSKAYRENVPLVVFFTAEWCNYCSRLRNEIVANPRVATLWTRAVLLVLDVDKDDAGGDVKKLREQLSFTEYPAIAVLGLSPQQTKVCGRLVGYIDQPGFFEWLTGIHSDFDADGAASGKRCLADR